jgi:iron-sulfur cluster assembly accessory protein
MIFLTERAANQLKEISAAEEIGYVSVRVICRGGQCAGLSYDIMFDDQIKDFDEVSKLDDVKVICDGISNLYMDGMSIDWEETSIGAGFTFKNPNATGTCGCGSSFSI